MKVLTKVTMYLAVVVAVLAVTMFFSLMIATPLNDNSAGYLRLLLHYGCALNAASVPLAASSIFLFFLCAVINNSQRKIGYKSSIRETFLQSFNFKDAPEWLNLLNAVAYLLLMVFGYARLSFLWNHCQ